MNSSYWSTIENTGVYPYKFSLIGLGNRKGAQDAAILPNRIIVVSE